MTEPTQTDPDDTPFDAPIPEVDESENPPEIPEADDGSKS